MMRLKTDLYKQHSDISKYFIFHKGKKKLWVNYDFKANATH